MNPKDNKKENKEYLPISELMEKDLPPIRWLIDDILPEEGITIMAAKPSSLKTWAALQMAIDIASGKKFLDKFETRQAPVLILDGESGERLLKNRLEVLKASKELPIYYQTYSGRKKFDKAFFDYTVAFCAVNKIKLVIFDSLIRFIDAKDENSSMDISEAFRWFSRLKEAGISVLLIHHSRKGTSDIDSLDSVRGSGDIIASCDVGIILFGRMNNAITIKVGKNRYDEETKPFRAEFKKDSDKTSHWRYLGVFEEKKRESEIFEIITAILEENGEMNQKNLIANLKATGLNIGEKKIRELLATLVLDGVIVEKPGSRTEKVYGIKGGLQNGQT